jgi:competence ComEA-like helix-hairpin-helix protein
MMRRGTRFSAGARRERRIEFRPAVCLLLVLIGGLLARAEPKKHPPAQPLDLNSSTAEELQQLPGVGPGMAKAIVDFRQKSGPFRRVEELLAIRGITKQRLEKIRPYVKIVPPDSKKPG